ncbi:MAG: nucleotidyltransferase family protein [Sulfurovum sp.]|nr:nucleotidyltransferase family protein [Sulfurovum sp.]
MKAMILAAGRGERMRPLTDKTPKPLLEVGGIALIKWHLERLACSGFNEIVINIAHLGWQIPQALGDGSQWGVKITYSDEQEEGALESAGGIVKALPLLGDETFLVLNGDIWTDYVFQPDKKLHKDILAHLILVPNPQHNPEGDFTLRDGFVVDAKAYTFSGIGYYAPELFKDVAYGKNALAPLLRAAMREGKVTGEIYERKWYDIGTPNRLADLNAQLTNRS